MTCMQDGLALRGGEAPCVKTLLLAAEDTPHAFSSENEGLVFEHSGDWHFIALQ